MTSAAKSATTKGARRYKSALRAQGAADTRKKILDTAMRLFVERGYGMVTVSDIAAEASLALQTVYASTGGKAAILSTLIDEAIRDPIVEKTLSAVRKSPSGQAGIEALAHGVRMDNERYHDIVQVMKTAAATDESATDILLRSDHEYRHALGQAARHLRNLKALRPDLNHKRATDVLWFYLGREAWHLLVADRAWSWDEAEGWLAAQASVALIAPA
jgi:AcrR family transcriptional regulator